MLDYYHILSLKLTLIFGKIFDQRRIFSFILLIFLFFYSIYSFKLPSAYIFNTDIARDSNDIIGIAQGKLSLVGPKLNFGGLYAGPYYYYLFVPILFMSNFQFVSILIFNSSIFALALIYFFLKVKNNFSFLWAILCTCLIGLLPLYVSSSRNPGNGFTYIPFLLFFLTYIYFNNIQNRKELFYLGLLAGIIVNFHPLNLVVFLSTSVLIFAFLKKRSLFIVFALGFLITYLPFIIFELRHDFVGIRRTIFDLKNLTLVRSVSDDPLKSSLISNYVRYSKDIVTFLILNPIYYAFLLPLPLILKKHFDMKNLYFTFASIASFLIYLIISHGYVSSHYVFPVSIFLFFAITTFVASYNLKFIALILIVLEIVNFNFDMYSASTKPYFKFESVVNSVLDNHLIDKGTPFNIIAVSDPKVLVPSGNEYRFFFRKNGYNPNSVNEYNKSKVLLVFVEIDNFNISSLQNWETGQFGPNYLDNWKELDYSDVKIYKISKETI